MDVAHSGDDDAAGVGDCALDGTQGGGGEGTDVAGLEAALAGVTLTDAPSPPGPSWVSRVKALNRTLRVRGGCIVGHVHAVMWEGRLGRAWHLFLPPWRVAGGSHTQLPTAQKWGAMLRRATV
jgi:hypothetical protein